MNRGWIKLHRELLDHPRFNNSAWLSVMTYLTLKATHTVYDTNFTGNIITLKPGQLVTGRKVIAAATGIHESTVKRILNMMKRDQEIDQLPSSKGSIITLRNWQQQQSGEQQTDRQATNERPASDQRATTIQERKEDKEQKHINNPLSESESFKSFWSEYPRKEGKQKTRTAFIKLVEPDAVELLPKIIAALERQKATDEWQREEGRFIPQPAKYITEKRWEDESTTGENDNDTHNGW